jgi:hypothetical protein
MSTGENAHTKSVRDTAWPDRLKDPQAIARYVAELSPYEICEEQIEEQFHGCYARLDWIELSSLSKGCDDTNLKEEERQETIDSLPVATMPRLLVENCVLQNGYHRLRKLLADGVTRITGPTLSKRPQKTF